MSYKVFVKPLVGITLSILGLLTLVGSAWADPPRRPAQDGPTDKAELAAFFDENMARLMEANHIPGAVVSVVKDGEVFFSKGYGYANLEKQTAFNPDTSLVRVGSVSKLFTWTAVMQLAEQGKLDLNTDINKYLTTFQVPATYPQPITLANLMDHTAGFEERSIGIAGRTKQDVPPLGDYLAQHLPARVRPPGVLSSYSNHGAALAGYIVSQVSGVPYEQYIQDHILTPLAMQHTTAWEPVLDALRADLAVSYHNEEGPYQAVPFIYDVLVPDGSITASATDMAHFMLAHLQNGRYNQAQLLQPATVQLMHSRSFSHNPQMDGWAHGFMELTINGQHAILHDGGWEEFESAMILLPEHNLGVFLSFNSPGGTQILPAFFNHYYPTVAPTPAPAPADPRVQPLAGFYKPARSTMSTVEKVTTLVDSARLAVLDDGSLQFAGKKWTSIGPLLYGSVEGTDRLAFLPNAQGSLTYAAISRRGYEKLPLYETIQFNLGVLGAIMVLILTALLGWPIAWLIRRRRPSGAQPLPGARMARWVAAVAGGLALVFIVLLVLVLEGDTSAFLYGFPLSFRLLMSLPIIVAVLTVVAVGLTGLAWRNNYWGLWGRLHYTLVTLALVGFLLFANLWNLLGFRFG